MHLAGPEPMKALALAACCLSAVLSVARGDYTWPDSRAFGGPDIGVYRLDLYRQNGPENVDVARRKRNVLVSSGKHILRLTARCIQTWAVLYRKLCLQYCFAAASAQPWKMLINLRDIACLLWQDIPCRHRPSYTLE